MVEVVPRLFVGDWREAQECLGSLFVITVAVDSPVTGVFKFGLVDGPGNSKELLLDAIGAVYEAHTAGKLVLVHCHGGRSRSCAVAVGAMVLITKRPLCECYDLLANTYPRTRIHPYLSKLLLEVLG